MNDFFEKLDRLLTALLGEGVSISLQRKDGAWHFTVSHGSASIAASAPTPMEAAVALRGQLRSHHEAAVAAEAARRHAAYAEVEAAFATVAG